MGLGKTIQALVAIERARRFPCLIVVGIKSAIGVWQQEIKKWTGRDSVVYHGTPMDRIVIWEDWDARKQPYLITNSAMLEELLQKQRVWPAVIFDEYHLMGLRNKKTKTFKTVKNLRAGMIIYSSGSPVTQGPQDLWAPLHILQPKKFPYYWPFVERHCVLFASPFGQRKIARYPKNPPKFREMLQPFVVRRYKKDVLHQLPPKTRSVVPLTLDHLQGKLYNQINEEMMAELGSGEIVVTPSVISKIMKLRQMLVSPKLIGDSKPGIGLQALLEHVRNEVSVENNVVIFTPFKEAVRLIYRSLPNSYPRYMITGGMKPDDLSDTIAKFQTSKKVGKVLIATIKSAVSFTAHAASVCYFLGQEWSHNDNVQAEDRLHRVGQKDNVRVIYFKHEHTIEEHVINTLIEKRDAASIILKPVPVIESYVPSSNPFR